MVVFSRSFLLKGFTAANTPMVVAVAALTEVQLASGQQTFDFELGKNQFGYYLLYTVQLLVEYYLYCHPKSSGYFLHEKLYLKS